MSNKSKAGQSAGIATRNAVNKVTGTATSGVGSVLTAVGGFFKGFIQGEPAPVAKPKAVKAKPQAKTVAKAKPVASKVKATSTKSN